jgi:y4mF family transcriptional regulator
MRRTLDEIYQTTGPIAVYVRQKRKELGYTQEVLAQRAGVGLRFLKELELGKKSLRLDKVNQIVEFLGGKLIVQDKETV